MTQERGRRRWWRIVGATVVLAAVALTAGIAVTADDGAAVTAIETHVKGTPEAGAAVDLDATAYLPSAPVPAPAILLAHGFGGSKRELDAQARRLAARGYVVLAYSARGFGASGGLIHLDAPDYEVADARLLIDHLAAMPEVALDAEGDPTVAVAGASYGGGLALLTAAYDQRVDAVAADITWNDLTRALVPDAAGGPGVLKKLWTSQLFAAAAGQGGDAACGRFAPELCAGYQELAQTGEVPESMRALLAASSPAGVLDRIHAPTLLTQGEQDSLFPLDEADANARGIAAAGTPVKEVWRAGGHDGGTSADDQLDAMLAWFDPLLAGRGTLDTAFEVTVPGSAISTSSRAPVPQVIRADDAVASRGTFRTEVAGQPQTIAAPAGGSPAAVTSLPGLGGLLGTAATALGQVGQGGEAAGAAGALSAIPGQVARFATEPLPVGVRVAGSSTVALSVSAADSAGAGGPTDATLFASLHDVAPNGADTLIGGLVAPLRLTGLTAGTPRDVTVTLPTVVAEVGAGHRLVVAVSTTDLAYLLPTAPRTYTVGLAGNGAAGDLVVGTVDGRVVTQGLPWGWLIAGLSALVVAALVVALGRLRPRGRRRRWPALADVPVSVDRVVKEYADGYRAVDDVSFRVERGQIVGLLGPNGAGKTTTLRVLMGLIRPTSGRVLVFGEPITPGAPVLARIGAFIEGPGPLPHLSGRENLRLYWEATGRAESDAYVETALEIAGLGHSIERAVRTYSQGMRQRLAIAQAMLGLPELLVLDEPTNGLDPLQIAEMREVLHRYAQTGRTVVISSHLLAEVEQTCSHVVVMHKGQLVAAGPVADIVATGTTRLAVDDPERAQRVLEAAGIESRAVADQRSLEDVFIEMVGEKR